MSEAHEIVPTPREEAGSPLDASPSPEAVLRAIAANSPKPWFPSVFASAAGIARDSLDEPLAELRKIGLAQIADWVRGQGQGYSLTPAGEACAKDSEVLAKLRGGPPMLPPPEVETLNEATKTLVGAKPVEAEAWPISKSVELDLRPPTVTPALLIANLAWFLIGLAVAIRWGVPLTNYLSVGDHLLLLRMGAVDGRTLLDGEWWRLITCCFVHIGLVHLLANLFALVMTGSLAELLWGRWRMALIYLLSGLAGSCMAMILHPVMNGGATILAGASGAIWGLMTSLLAWLLLNRDHLPPALVADWSRKLTLMFILNIGVSFIPGVSWSGHLGGGVAGFIAAGLLNTWRFSEGARRAGAIALLLILPVAFIASLGAAMKSSAAWTALRAVEERKAWSKSREDAFENDIAPKLSAIRPEYVRKLYHLEIAPFVIAGGQTRLTEERASLVAEVERLQTLAREAVAFLKDRSTTNDKLNARLARNRNFAEAQLVFLNHLRELLDSKTLPEMEEWKTLKLQQALAERYAEPLWGKPPPLEYFARKVRLPILVQPKPRPAAPVVI